MFRDTRGVRTDMASGTLLLPLLALVVCVVLPVATQQLYLGDDCDLDIGSVGICKRAHRCPYAQAVIANGGRPQVCFYDRNAPIVCCPPAGTPIPKPTTKRPRPTKATPRPPKTPAPTPRPPKTPAPTSPPATGKSWQKCQEYAKEVYREIYVPTLTFENEVVKEADCAQAAQQLIIGGKRCEPKEFPHMVALGFGDEPNIAWLCGGSLISERFILTAAHCLNAKGRGKVKWVQLGDLNIATTTDDSKPQRQEVVEAIPHPGYKPPSHYNDIALLRLKSNVTFNAYVRPACLNTNADVTKATGKSHATATGWGVTDWANEELSKDLMKVDLKFHTAQRCNETFKSLITSSTKLVRGFTEDTMICAGDPQNQRDTCVGDSGGPLQQSLTTPYCMYSIVGLTSFGSRACGESNSPAVYTRVSFYIPWIENIIWP